MNALARYWYRLPNVFRFTARRLLVGVLLCLGVTVVSFSLTQVVPGDPITANLGERAAGDPEIVAAFRAKWGLDRSLPEQYIAYVGRLAQGDLGESQQTRRPVSEDLAQYMGATLELAITAITIALVIGVTLRTIASVFRDRWQDQAIRVPSLAAVSIPTFWLALVCLYVFFFKLGRSPGVGRLGPGAVLPPTITGLITVDALLTGNWKTFQDAIGHLILPAMVLSTYTVGSITRFTRAAMLESLGHDYVRAARAKGLSSSAVILRHALRPALAAIVTVTGMAFGRMLAGAVLVESVFSWPGIGLYAYRSALALDLQAIIGVSLLVAVIYITVNLIVDLLYAVIDPRIRLG